MTIFSKIINGEIASYKIAESAHFFAFLDIFPLQKGHTLIVPKIEIDKVFDLPDSFMSELMLFAKPIAKAIEASFECNRVSMVTVGLEVPHAHIHLIPINNATDIDFARPKLTLNTEEFEAIQALIISHL
ncbi:MAG: HIT family protein [Sediminibacterium sp.]|jgi:histidine triad (HIT) family protein